MRIRSIKPDFWASEDIASLDWPTRLLFIGLWSYVDDNGVGRDSEKLIAASLFPLEDDPRETLATVSRGLVGLSEGGQIDRYSVDGKPYLYVNAWDSHQRIDKRGKDRYPLPTSDNALRPDTLATSSRDSRDTLAPGEGEKGRRGGEEEGRSSSSEIANAIRPDDERPDVEELLDFLDARIEENGAKRPKRNKGNRNAMRLLLDRDGRNAEQVRAAIEYATGDDFWRANVLSAAKLREKYDQLSLNAQRDKWKRPSGRHERYAEFWEQELAQARSMDTPESNPLALEAK